MTIKSRAVCLKSYPSGLPTPANFEIITETVKPADEGEITVKNHFMSVDPYMRGRMSGIKTYADPYELGQPMTGGAVGEIIHSGHKNHKVGDFVMTLCGWREAFTAPVSVLQETLLQKLDTGMLPAKSYLGIAGMPGVTAYVGLYKIAEFQPGETVLVSGAAGAVGSVVCQLAKADGATVIGIAGGESKCKWLESQGIDAAIDYKNEPDLTKAIQNALKKAGKASVDVYFENVGGDMLEAALNTLGQFGRIAACGMISQYNNDAPTPGPSNLVNIVGKSLKIQGFIVSDHMHCALEYFGKLGPLMASGQVQAQDTIETGIENAVPAFLRLFSGDKKGKMLVKLA